MQHLTISIPHQQGRDEAKRRLQGNMKTLRLQHGHLLSEIHETWTDDRVDFALAGMGQTVTGHMEVTDNLVHVSVALPWLLQMLAGTIRQQIGTQVGHMLEGPDKPK